VLAPCIGRYVWVEKTASGPLEKQLRYEELHGVYSKRIVDLFMELGGPYIKFGQVNTR
jgi:predicted unusual protein kinase regulating ubiquinone biosynthesis (AarF/ABC1/UbiB family)